MLARRTNTPFADEVPRLLQERGWSIRRLAQEAGVERGYLWKVIRRRGYKTPSLRMAENVAVALGLPPDYFPEYRERLVIDRVKRDPKARDEVFDSLAVERPGGVQRSAICRSGKHGADQSR